MYGEVSSSAEAGGHWLEKSNNNQSPAAAQTFKLNDYVCFPARQFVKPPNGGSPGSMGLTKWI